MLTAKDIMTTEVCSVSPDMEVDELARQFVALKKNAMPVLDASGRLTGIVTQTDLVERDKPLHIPTVISLFDWVFYLESEKSFRDEVKRISARKVGDICTREVVTCSPDTPVDQIASLMVDNKAHLVPVVDADYRVLGVVARLDIIRSMGV
jgi:CBS-domain-containing membrane protein